ncbi:MAG: hypothetical protein HY690_13750 [Chloroflexi bacterium]|nr:hypothetical protein [Chloroflexota bacterium]
MDYEYQIISLPLGQACQDRTMPMPQGEGNGDYAWRLESGATAVLMHFVRLGWEPVRPLGVVNGTVSMLLRKRLIVAGRAGH